METLGERIKYLRNQLTQEELSAILQVDRSTLASWEINRREPDITTLCRIADHFDVTIDWLVGHSPEKKQLGHALHEHSRLYQTLIDPHWQNVISIAQSYGLESEDVRLLLEAHVKLALSIKNEPR